MKVEQEIRIQMGERIRTAREDAGYTQDDLADRVDLTVQYISDLERGKVGTSVASLMKLCTVLGVSSDFLLFGRTDSDGEYRSAVIQRLRYLSPKQRTLAEKGINVLLDALNYVEKPTIND